ncbi:thermonuclease family protein [Desulfovibrio mangrovi]|uniref:thermonuclease family protein n=1 Tax=Desulfovibrio mangrovi TaxID=2976983 RepID=UPI0022462C4A|nr:thermonuclease family protein [Desulfovibrio mangrovi]UZP67987.1 thermonuclease family protein [Desulfovibrio mangrovi]
MFLKSTTSANGLPALVLLVCLLVYPTAAKAHETNYGDMEAVVVRVVDGDTIIVDIPDLPPVIGKNIGIRISGCDTPELHDKRPEKRALAQQAKSFVTTLLQGKKVRLKDVKRGKYFRLIADVVIQQISLSTLLIDEGYAKPYFGGKKGW